MENRFTDFCRSIFIWFLDEHMRALNYMVFFKYTFCKKYIFYLVSKENMKLFSKHHCCCKCQEAWQRIKNKVSPPDSKGV